MRSDLVGEPHGGDLRYDEGGRPALSLRHPLPLLESLVSDHLDPGYQAAADRRAALADDATSSVGTARAGRSRATSYLSAGLVIVGLVLGVAAASTQDQAAGADQARLGLLQDIDTAQAKQSALASRQNLLADEVRSAQAALGVGGPLQTVQALEVQGAVTAVTGPGLTVVIDGSTTSSGAGVILDRDIQLLINGLWSSGAEAIAIGGVRLRTTSAIRQAGNAILVDNRPVFFPLGIEAIGDPSNLHVKFVDTIGFGRFQTFVSLYGIRFDISAQSTLTLPAGASPDLRYASAPVTAVSRTRSAVTSRDRATTVPPPAATSTAATSTAATFTAATFTAATSTVVPTTAVSASTAVPITPTPTASSGSR
ncbi:uncharacterized protein YlxW (UPF0749 family) [Nakamurella sp. UYEF19]|uniref:DUF881 domain-containing protein n=1 Tax=Nakamurella sp. UYEF19 TaxID=1756392 RepID=UPI003392202B